MWERSTPFSGKCSCGSMSLYAVWDVGADPSYDIAWPQDKEDIIYPGSFALCHTLKGDGKIFLKPDEQLVLAPSTVVLMRCEDIRRYHCMGNEWRFHWVEYGIAGAPGLPLNNIVSIPKLPRYDETFYSIGHALDKGTYAHRRLAAATFSTLLYEWSAYVETHSQERGVEDFIEGIIDEMHNRICNAWSVAEMAESVGVSEAAFRKRFRNATGVSPKKYYDTLRMELANSLLRQGLYTVAEVSDHLHFCDPFHFSKMFKKHFRESPASVRETIE